MRGAENAPGGRQAASRRNSGGQGREEATPSHKSGFAQPQLHYGKAQPHYRHSKPKPTHACRDSHSPPVVAAFLSARSIVESVTKPSPFESKALNSLVRASTTAVSELSVSWPKRGAGATADCRQLTAGATAPLPTRDEVATSAVAAA
eukprot:scaffold41789_cov53-Phaeocystis_antarctica.AAC.2